MSYPQVSILLAVRNEQSYLPAALASLQAQTLSDWELIAVDDGSRDATAAILAAAARRDRRIRLFRRPWRGLVAALNYGLARCRAPLIARMDGDDLCHPRRLQLQASFLRRHPDIGLVATAVRHFPRHRISDGMRAYESWQNDLIDPQDIQRDLYVESPFAHPSVMLRKRILAQAGGYQDHPWAEDYDLWLRLARLGVRFARLPQVLLFWRDRPRRLTRTAPQCSAAAFRACKIHHLRQGFLRHATAVTLWGAGMEGKAWRKALDAAGIGVTRWIEVDRRKIGQRIHGAPVLGAEELHPGGPPLLVTIGARNARPQVRAWAAKKGLCEGRDFMVVT
ncbi:glycosyltransferase [Geoalkalibacter halelectricus]|uniref:Glycosyltransferase n=1 Tax=Geoalkalibacter halelectricus TaxID=2847045 RepID=A0ABY5ZHG1_9BACT|nr:glycosyltransferase [Geoalkalibacter halelectricus]MDO3379601.1 glycosyltransferase [Geoalkalibacter halelectricus]UWZ78583.1 glycosyltransferase [Geoalkalibacter halelectricus]